MNKYWKRLKILWQKKKLLFKSNFSFCNVFSKVVCWRGIRKYLYVGRVNADMFWCICCIFENIVTKEVLKYNMYYSITTLTSTCLEIFQVLAKSSFTDLLYVGKGYCRFMLDFRNNCHTYTEITLKNPNERCSRKTNLIVFITSVNKCLPVPPCYCSIRNCFTEISWQIPWLISQ